MEKPCLRDREIEVTVISAEDLRLSRKQPVKKNAFIVIKSDPLNSRSTAVDTEGGSYPTWNEKLRLQLPSHAHFVTVEAHCGRKVVGAANIPVTDFAGGFLPENYLSFLSYRLRDGNGEKNGIVNLSVVVKGAAGKGRGGGGAGGFAASSSGRAWEGVAVVGGKMCDQGVVTGVPVPVPYRY